MIPLEAADLTYIKIILSIIALLIAIIGYFVKKEISTFGGRIDRHDSILFDMTGNIQRLIGYYEGAKQYNGEERRRHVR